MEKRSWDPDIGWKRKMVDDPMMVAFRLDDCLGLDRVGIIPYFVVDGKKYYLLAQDHKTKELGDFGGGIKFGEGERALDAAFREWTEESRGILSDSFYKLPRGRLEFSPAIFHPKNKTAIIFVKVQPIWKDLAAIEFNNTPALEDVNKEVSGIKWVSERNLVKLIKKEKVGMWRKIRQVLGSIDAKVLMEGIDMAAGEE